MGKQIFNAVDSLLLMDSLSTAPGFNTYVATGVAQVDGADGVIDRGTDTANYKDAVISLFVKAAVDTDASETYFIEVEQSNDPAFATLDGPQVTKEIAYYAEDQPELLTITYNQVARYHRVRFVLAGTAPSLEIQKGFMGDLP